MCINYADERKKIIRLVGDKMSGSECVQMTETLSTS